MLREIAIAFGTAMIASAIAMLLSRFCNKIAPKFNRISFLKDWLQEISSDIYRGGVAQSINFFISFCFYKFTNNIQILTGNLITGFCFIGAALIISLISVVSNSLSKFYRNKEDINQRDRSVTLTIIPITASILRYFNIGLWGVIIASAWGFDIAPILTGSAVILAVFGFAGQAILQDLLGFLSLIIDRPFYVGSEVEFLLPDDVQERGTVEAITLRNTVLKSDRGYEFFIPNRDAKNFRVWNK